MAAHSKSAGGIGRSLLRQVLDLSCEGVLILRLDGDVPRIRYANSQFTRLSGFTQEELAKRDWSAVCHDICAADLADVVRRNERYCGTLLMENADGTRWRAGVRIRPLVDDDDPGCWLCQFIPPSLMSGDDVELAHIWFDQDGSGARQRFGRLDRIDGSSGLLRFERFGEFFERDLAMALREKRSVTLALMKIMEFSEYRCTFGVNAANSCLGMIGKQVTATLRRRTDLCARLNDDTIVVAVVGQSADEVSVLVNRIADNVAGLRIHNPRGTYSRFLALHSAITACDEVSSACTAESLIAAAREELERTAAESLSA